MTLPPQHYTVTLIGYALIPYNTTAIRMTRRIRAAFAVFLLLASVASGAPAAEAAPVETTVVAATPVMSVAQDPCAAIGFAAGAACGAAEVASEAAETPEQRAQADRLAAICAELIREWIGCVF